MFVLLSAIVSLQMVAQAPYPLFEADNANISYTGRIDFSNPKKPKFWQPGVYIEVRFKGTFCEVVINDEVLWGKNHNYIEIVIDGTQLRRIQLTDKENHIKVAENLPEGQHTILICKNTEAGIGYLEFIGFRCEKLLPPSKKPVHKIEFFGDSITCGTGSDLSEIACDKREWYDQHNAYLSYGPLTARSSNSQWHLSSVSGIGMIHSCCDMKITMPDVADKIDMRENKLTWDFNRYIPDIVTICLGQNDGSQDSVAFCSAYIKFIETIRSHSPKANIVCITSPMADTRLTGMMKNYLTGVQNYLRKKGDKKISTFFFSRSYNKGCGGHPDLTDHQLIANELTTFLKKTFRW
jgi:lysophospholipase L1-like esterase